MQKTQNNITQMSFLQNRKKRETEILTFCVITLKRKTAIYQSQILGIRFQVLANPELENPSQSHHQILQWFLNGYLDSHQMQLVDDRDKFHGKIQSVCSVHGQKLKPLFLKIRNSSLGRTAGVFQIIDESRYIDFIQCITMQCHIGNKRQSIEESALAVKGIVANNLFFQIFHILSF